MKIDDTRNGYIKIDVGIDRAWEGGWLKVTGLTVKQQEDINTLLEAYKKITGVSKSGTRLTVSNIGAMYD